MGWQRVIMANEWDAQSILGAVSDNTPTAITFAASTVFGRRAAGDITAISYTNLESDLTGLTKVDGSRDFTGTVVGVTPTSDSHLATKGYVDTMAQGLDVKASVVCLSDTTSTEGTGYSYNATGGSSGRGQITWTSGPTTIDGVTLSDDDRILNAETGAAGGIYVRTGVNTWDRATDFDEDDEVTAGAFVFIEEGTSYADSGWVLATNDPITIGGGSGTSLSWSQFSGAGSITAGAGLTKTGNTINLVGASASALDIQADSVAVNPDGSTLEINGTGPGTLQIKALGVDNSHIATSADIARSKLAAGTPNYFVVNAAGTGVMTEVVKTGIPLSGFGDPASDIAMASFKFTGLAAGTVAGDSVRYEQVMLLDGSQPMTGTLDTNGQNITLGAGDLNFEGGKARNMLLDPLATPPGTPGVGQVYFDTAVPGLFVWFA